MSKTKLLPSEKLYNRLVELFGEEKGDDLTLAIVNYVDDLISEHTSDFDHEGGE